MMDDSNRPAADMTSAEPPDSHDIPAESAYEADSADLLLEERSTPELRRWLRARIQVASRR